MTDQSLRDALEELLKQRAVKGKGTVANSQLRELLTQHPDEPTVSVVEGDTLLLGGNLAAWVATEPVGVSDARYLYDCETCDFAVQDEAKAQEHRDDNPTHEVFEKRIEPVDVGVSDEAVGRVADALVAEVKKWPMDSSLPWDSRVGVGATFHELARVALTAAAPLMGATPRPKHCTNCEADTFACTACGAQVESGE